MEPTRHGRAQRAALPNGRMARSEDHREFLESKWFNLTKKLLVTRKGPFSLPMTGLGTIVSQACTHPIEQQVTGGNQYGRWTNCLKCNVQLSFDRWGPDNPKPTSKKSKKQPALDELPEVQCAAELRQVGTRQSKADLQEEQEATGVESADRDVNSQSSKCSSPSTSSSSQENPMSRGELQEVLSQHTRELSVTLAQHLNPLVQNQVRLQEQMGYLMMPIHSQLPMTPHAAEEDQMMNPNDDWHESSQG
eukprot:s2955_g3.t1